MRAIAALRIVGRSRSVRSPNTPDPRDRMRQLIVFLVLSLLASSPLRAQALGGAGISPRRLGEERTSRAPLVWANAPSRKTATTHSRWTWIAVGAVLGGAVGGTMAARQVARTDDAFFGGPSIELGVVVGVVGGGLIGALAHATLHPAPTTLSPDDR